MKMFIVKNFLVVKYISNRFEEFHPKTKQLNDADVIDNQNNYFDGYVIIQSWSE